VIVYSLSGEYQASYIHPKNNFTREDYDALGQYVYEYNRYSHPVTIHPRSKWGLPPGMGYTSSIEFHDSYWLDHNWIQTYFYIDAIIPTIQNDYSLEPTKPVVLSEGAYEAEEPLPDHEQNYAVVDRYLSRLQAWSAFLNGAAGYTYGANGVWHMYDPSFPDPGLHQDYTRPWYENLSLEGSSDMQHIRSFFSNFDWGTAQPQRSWLLVNGQPAPLPSPTDFSPSSLLAKWAELYVAYIPVGNSGNEIEILNLGCREYTAQWYNPRNAEYIEISDSPVFVNRWKIPPPPDAEDWVILIKATDTLHSEGFAPIIDAIPDDTAQEGMLFVSERPVLLEEASCVTWILSSGPYGMEIDSTNGAVSWADPASDGSPYEITVRAINTAGFHEQSWYLVVDPSSRLTADNTSQYFSILGNWSTSSVVPGYYLNDYSFASPGSGSKQATWSFSVASGQYTISAQWAAFENRASNAKYRIFSNGTEFGMQVFDQRINGGRFNDFDVVYTVPGGTLEVMLTDDADGYVIADAVQVMHTGPAGNFAPEGVIDSPSAEATIAVGGVVDFSGTGMDPDGDLALSYHWDFGDSSIADSDLEDPGLVQFDNIGIFSVVFTVTDSQGLSDPTPAAVVVNVQDPSAQPVVVDNTDAGFSTSGSWSKSSFTPGYYDRDYRFASPGSGSNQATWSFPVVAGQYAISAQWAAFENRAGNAKYRVFNNGIEIGEQLFDQRVNGGRFKAFDTTYAVAAGTLDVVLADDADGYIIADALQVVPMGSGGNFAPNGIIDSPLTEATIAVGGVVEFSGMGMDPDGDLALSYHWDFGDPSMADSDLEDPGLVQFDNIGIFSVVFTVTDSQGLSDPTPATVVVNVQDPTAQPVVVDNTGPGFSISGSWGASSFTPGYYGSDYRFASPGSGTNQATWSFPVVAGQYAISAQWAAFENRAGNAKYRVFNNGIEIGEQLFDQRVNGGRFNAFDTTYAVAAGTLDVVLADDADGYIIADALQMVFSGN